MSDSHVVYTTKDPKVPEPSHTRQNVSLRITRYVIQRSRSSIQICVVDFKAGMTQELTSGAQGATSFPVFSHLGNKVAWLEMDKDGYYADRYASEAVIYLL